MKTFIIAAPARDLSQAMPGEYVLLQNMARPCLVLQIDETAALMRRPNGVKFIAKRSEPGQVVIEAPPADVEVFYQNWMGVEYPRSHHYESKDEADAAVSSIALLACFRITLTSGAVTAVTIV